MSSSESDDDEEAQRINEAVFCDESQADLFNTAKKETLTAVSANIHTAAQGKKGELQPKTASSSSYTSHKIFGNVKFKASQECSGTSKAQLKSNRPHLNEDDRHRQIVKTTPEFRAFVAKHLEKLLDQELETCLTRSVWKSFAGTHGGEKAKQKRCHGVKLLANSTNVLTDIPKKEKPQLKKEQKISTVKKPRLSTSSESSEDEKISACVFTVQDIEEENKILTSLARNNEEKPEEKSDYLNDVSKILKVNDKGKDLDHGKDLKKAKKKKKKKKSEIKEKDVS